MSDFTPLATTRQAAKILGVHESSIKRWNTSAQLHAQQTQGGHRRFAVEEILTFARKNRLNAPLLAYDTFAVPVWVSTEHLRKKKQYTLLVELLYEWIMNSYSAHANRLLMTLLRESYSISDLFDNLVSPALKKLNNEYLHGKIAIGEEQRGRYCMRDTLIHLTEQLREQQYVRPTRESPIAIVGCCREEEEEIGAIMARLVLEMSGWSTIYLGLDVPTEEFAKQQLKHDAAIIFIALMPPRGERDIFHILNLLDQVYSRKHPYRLAFSGPTIPENQAINMPGGYIPEIRSFQSMKALSQWIQLIED